jgi:hypothetical protein
LTEAVGGELRTGIPGAGGIVVKFHTEENALVPLIFFAFTLQKYWVLVERALSKRFVVAIVESSRTIELKSESVATWHRYDAAPGEEFQVNDTVVGTLRDPFAGDNSPGVEGIPGTVVKFQTDE